MPIYSTEIETKARELVGEHEGVLLERGPVTCHPWVAVCFDATTIEQVEPMAKYLLEALAEKKPMWENWTITRLN